MKNSTAAGAGFSCSVHNFIAVTLLNYSNDCTVFTAYHFRCNKVAAYFIAVDCNALNTMLHPIRICDLNMKIAAAIHS